MGLVSKKVVKEECSECRGKGYVTAGLERCSECSGDGYVSGLFGDKVCPRCDGYKQIHTTKTCPDCKGSGFEKVVERVYRCDECGKLEDDCTCIEDKYRYY